MIREILFRGKRIDNGNWVHGYVTRIKHTNGKENVEGYYFNALDELGWVAECAVSAETVCQYTGLTDKNGRKIFEGDIIKQFADCDELGKDLYYFYKIRWNKKYCAFEGFEIYTKETFLFPDLEDIEVIGNIFDNPELVEKPKCSGCKCCNCFSKSECCPECEGPILDCEEYSETDIYNPDRMEGGAE